MSSSGLVDTPAAEPVPGGSVQACVCSKKPGLARLHISAYFSAFSRLNNWFQVKAR